MTKAEYIETVRDGDDRTLCARVMLLVPLATTGADLVAADLSITTGITPTQARAVSVPLAESLQAAVADGRLVLP